MQRRKKMNRREIRQVPSGCAFDLLSDDPAKHLFQGIILMLNERPQRIIDRRLVVPTTFILDFRPEPVENVTVKTDRDPDLLPGRRQDGSASGLPEIIFRFHILEPLTASLCAPR